MPPPISDLLRSRGGQTRNNNSANNTTNSNEVLPLHINNHNNNSNGTTSAIGRKSAASTISTNNFLLGGMYVPNKDKRRNYKRRRVMGYNHRYGNFSIVSICQNAYVRYPFMIICVGFFVMIGMLLSQQHRVGQNVGDSAAQRRNTHNTNHRRKNHPNKNIDGLLKDETLMHRLPSIQESKTILTRFTEDRNKYQQLKQHQQVRFKLLEMIVPEWYHRNDPKTEIPAVTTDTRNDIIDADVAEPPRVKLNHNTDTTKSTNSNSDRPSMFNDDIIHVRPSSNRIRRTLQNNIHNMTTHHLSENNHLEDLSKPVTTVAAATTTTITSSCPRNLSATNISVSLLIQSSMDRLWILQETCQRWKSPIIVVVAVPDDDPTTATGTNSSSTVLQKHLIQWKQSCSQLKVIVYHLDSTTESTPESYPVNTLRNVALDAVSTSHILMMDIDFIPSQRLDSMIQSALVAEQQHATAIDTKDNHENRNQNNVAMVIPAFDRVLHPPCTSSDECAQHLQSNSNFIPLDFQELQQCYSNDECIIFQSMDNWEGHSSTRTELWLQQKWNANVQSANDQNNVRTIPCFDSLRYEPYVVVRWCPSTSSSFVTSSDVTTTATTTSNSSNRIVPVAPYYDERFHGYGKNKIQLISHLRLMGYRFTVLPRGGFIVHNPHVESSSKAVWNNIQEHSLHRTMDVLYQTFLNELVSIYLTGVQHGGTEPKDIVGACTKKRTSQQLE